MSIRAADLMELPQEQVAQLNQLLADARTIEVEIGRMDAAGIDTTELKTLLASAKAQANALLTHFGPGSARRAAAATRRPGSGG